MKYKTKDIIDKGAVLHRYSADAVPCCYSKIFLFLLCRSFFIRIFHQCRLSGSIKGITPQ